MKSIGIKTNKNKFYRQFLELLRSIPPVKFMRPKELDVLAEVMLQYNKYKHLGQDIGYELVFSTENRRRMMDSVGIKQDSFNNNLSILRKHKALTTDNKLNKFFESVSFEDGYNLEFIFKNDEIN